MVLLAKRVSASQCAPKSASTSETPKRLGCLLDCVEQLAALALRQNGVVSYPAYAAPTLMLWKRAGLAPWPVPITCSGCPLPQFGTPHSTQ